MDLLALNEEIEKSGKTKEYLAKVLNITRYSIYNKLSGATEFKASEMTLLAEELNLSIRKKNEIFFGKKSEYNSQKDLSVSPSYLAGWNEGERKVDEEDKLNSKMLSSLERNGAQGGRDESATNY